MTEVEQPPPQNGIDLSATEDDDNSKARPADIEQDMREMERRKRVEAIMSSKLFREELERIVDSARDGGGILQQLSDIMGVPSTRVGSVFKASNCMLPINDIRGVESMGYAKGEKILRCKLAATFRLLDLYGWTQGLGAQITARLKVDQENFLVNPYGMMFHEITASSLNKVDMQGQIVEQGTTNFGVNKSHFALHSVVHAARPDIRCAIYIGCSPVVAVSSLKAGLLPLTRDACMLGEVTTHPYTGALADAEERDKLVRALGPVSKVLILSNYGALCCGETIEEAFFAASHIVKACETQLKLLPVGVDNLVLIPEESRKIIYEQSRRPPEDLEKKFAAVSTAEGGTVQEEAAVAKEGAAIKATGSVPKWRVGGAEFEALMRMLDNAGYRTGYIYRHPLIKSDPPKPKNDVELPPAVSSLGYLLEEEELLKQGIWKKGDLRKGGDRSRWLNSPNVYQKVEVLETGTPDPKKITKWVAEGSPTHSTPVRIEDPLQFVPAGTNPKEFKRLQQQIKDNRRADKISAGPQSHILEGVTWDEANRIKDATVSSAGDHVVLMGAASKGIIQRGFQHNAAVYKAPYAKNPFDNVTDDELNEYKRTVERKKKSIHGEYTDTDFSESEPLSSLQTSGAQQQTKQTTTTTAAVSQSEPEDVSEHQVMRIQTQQAPVPSQPEVVLSDANSLPIITHATTTQKYIFKDHLTQKQNYAEFERKYAFLYERPVACSTAAWSSSAIREIYAFMIHKIEIFPHYTYPLPETNNNKITCQQSEPTIVITPNYAADEIGAMKSAMPSASTMPLQACTLQPYRTVSHYGFNYPMTYLPHITLHPAHLLTAVQLQRQKVIAFIKSTAMSLSEADRHFQSKKASPQDNSSENTTGSYISVKEIQLQPKQCNMRRISRPTSAQSLNADVASTINNTTPTDQQQKQQKQREREQLLQEQHDAQDALSDQLMSLLSVGTTTYPADTHSHGGNDHEEDVTTQEPESLHEHEHEQDHDEHNHEHNERHHHHDHDHDHEQYHHIDSADNNSVLSIPRVHTLNVSDYTRQHTLSPASYMMRNFLPPSSPLTPDNELQHKPEAEQAMHAAAHAQNARHIDDAGMPAAHQHQTHKQIKLTLNSNALKRRCSHSSQDAASSSGHSQHDHYGRHVTASVSETDSTATSLKSLEIHVNISVQNSDCVRSLQTHEQEFRKKLERLIDDEINLIAQQLGDYHKVDTITKADTVTLPILEVSTAARSIETPERQQRRNRRKTWTNVKGSPSMAAAATPPLAATPSQTSLSALRQAEIVCMLEQELESLLNGIICANALHNHAVMCDCKMKVAQISEDLRTSLSGTK